MKRIDWDAVKDYAIYAALMAVLIGMVGSCLMMIKTMSLLWYIVTVITTAIGVIAGSWRFNLELDIPKEDELEEEKRE